MCSLIVIQDQTKLNYVGKGNKIKRRTWHYVYELYNSQLPVNIIFKGIDACANYAISLFMIMDTYILNNEW